MVGCYALATAAVDQARARGPVRRNVPDPIPVMIIGRLAADRAYQGRGIAQDLLRDAILRTLQTGEIAGIRAVLAHDLGGC